MIHGCGDLVNDYEGITGYEHYRDDLRLLYLVALDADTGRLRELRITPLRSRRLRLYPAATEDLRWLRGLLDTIAAGFAPCAAAGPGGALTLRPA